MNITTTLYKSIPLAVLLPALLISSGCDSGSNTTSNAIKSGRIKGNALDGPIKGGTVEARIGNKIIASSTTTETGGYNIDIPEDTQLPIIISITGGIDLVTSAPLSFSLNSIITTDSFNINDRNINIDTLSTLVVASYQLFPERSIKDSLQNIIGSLSFGLSPDINPITTPIDKDNAADIIKANQAAIEFIKRLSVLSQKSLPKTFIALAEDLTDGVIDCKVAERIEATQLSDLFCKQARITQFEVISEVLENRLRITDEKGTTLISADESAKKLNEVIKINQAEADASQTTENVETTQELVNEVLEAIADIETYTDAELIDAGISAPTVVIFQETVDTLKKEAIDLGSFSLISNMVIIKDYSGGIEIPTSTEGIVDNGVMTLNINQPFNATNAALLTQQSPEGTSPTLNFDLRNTPKITGKSNITLLLKDGLNSNRLENERQIILTVPVTWGPELGQLAAIGDSSSVQYITADNTLVTTSIVNQEANFITLQGQQMEVAITKLFNISSLGTVLENMGVNGTYFYQVQLDTLPLFDKDNNQVSVIQGIFSID